METANRRYTTISIPQPLYEEVKRAIEGTGFRSPTEFLVYVTRLSLQSPLARGEVNANPFASTPQAASPAPRVVPPYR
jgi:hypothetical protein